MGSRGRKRATLRSPGYRVPDVKLLCAADIHLGRQPSRLPAALADRAAALRPAAAWRRLVDLALEERVDALLLAGDVVDRDDDFFEAFADLRAGAERLATARIPVLAVAGNHDTRVLPRLAEAVDGVTVLGRGGRWQEHALRGRDGVRVTVLGWSFPRSVTTEDPLQRPLPQRGPEVTIGLLHCDRDQAASGYAPVRSADLRAAPVDAWLLGHVHRPDIAIGERPMGYLGSLAATDPGEPGPHGAWLLEVASDGRLGLHSRPLAPLRWERLEVDLSDLQDAADAPVRITRALDDLHGRLVAEGDPAEAVGCRLALVGRTSLRAEAARVLARDDPRNTLLSRNGTAYFVHAWRLEALPELDLEALAREPSPLGLLARTLLLLQGRGDPQARAALLGEAARHLAAVPERRYLSAAAAEPPDEASVAELLESAALYALDALVGQKVDAA